ncbi:DUF523 domain-containing protein [Psychromonas sp. MME2]|uniref:DUF523 domain-containing protein n=1 Tax=unclassified Psychromonas TaxID=2614957 RepID=UPI00339BC02E
MPKDNNIKILISACLLGERVRYDGKINKLEDPLIMQWQQKKWLLPVCPEVCGGLATPRAAAEIQVDGSIKTASGEDVSVAFKLGAQKTLQLALENKVKVAILTEKSPSCGSSLRYDGSFNRTLVNGEGCTAKLLRAHNIAVFNQFNLADAQAYLQAINDK